MLLKRIAVIVISLVLGAAITVGLVTLLGTTVAEYGMLYFSLTSFFIAAAIAIWLDKFMGTDFLPE
jgi:hypothetical protein